MKLLILDRDGVINYDSPQFIKSPDEWRPIPGSLEAIARFTQAGYRVVVATNQSGIGRGLFDMATLNAIHDKMHRQVAQAGGRIDAIFYCPDTADSNSFYRKPNPGMLVEIGEYERGSDPLADEAIAKMDRINAFLRQRVEERSTVEEARNQLVQMVTGWAAANAAAAGQRTAANMRAGV